LRIAARKGAFMRRRLPIVGALAALLGCGGSSEPRFGGTARVSAASPFTPNCGGTGQSGVNHAGGEVEPYVAADPSDANHFIVSWQQDRWSTGGSLGIVTAATFDAGKTWTTPAPAPVSRCGGGVDYQRASNAWVTIDKAGKAWLGAISFDDTTPRSAILVSRSDDGGKSWGQPTSIIADDTLGVLNDKQAITADPTDPARVYIVWDRVTNLNDPNSPNGSGPALFSALNGDGSWTAPATIYDPGTNAQTISNQLVVLPDGTLADLFLHLTDFTLAVPNRRLEIATSPDHGATWSAPIPIAAAEDVGVFDRDANVAVRGGDFIPDIAVDPKAGTLYVAWEDGRFSGGDHEGIALSVSVDKGQTWSAPRQVNQVPSVPAFEPKVSVSSTGAVGLLYADLRDDKASDGAFTTSFWLAISNDQGAHWTETQVGADFDLRGADFVGLYFLGDYQGLAPAGAGFMTVVAATTGDPGDPTDIFANAR
jgi:hypothetical protein